MEKDVYEIIITGTTGNTFNIPIFLNQDIQELGVMVGFDGDISQNEQLCNFTYSGYSNSVTVYNTVNTNLLSNLINAIYNVDWGDGSPYDTLGMPGISFDGNPLPYITHTYSTNGNYTITVTINSPWDTSVVEKNIVIPFTQTYGYPTDFGTLTFTVPYTNPPVLQSQTYIEDYTTLTGDTNPTIINFVGIGKSRIDEVKNYGISNTYSGLTITDQYTGYTIDDLFYMDFSDGFTQITGTTSGNTITFYQDEIYNGMITRNEHFIGFIDDPQIYSDIFVERGKLGVLENNLRLCEITSTGELDVYGGGFFKIKKQ